MVRCREQQGILAYFLYLNMSPNGMWRKNLHKVSQLDFGADEGWKIAIFGQKVPKNLYFSNKCLLAESSKE